MATLKYRLHRKNESGAYDKVHLETTADLVLFPDGTNVKDLIEAGLIPIQDEAPTGTEKFWLNTSMKGEFGNIPVQDAEPVGSCVWIDTSEEGSPADFALKNLSNVPNDDLLAKLEASGFSGSGGLQMKLLWENASPASGFGAQTLSIDFSGFDYIIIDTILSIEAVTLANYHYVTNMIKGGALKYYGSIGTLDRIRSVTYSEGTLSFSACTDYKGSSWAVPNAHCIPYKIYGIKGSYN